MAELPAACRILPKWQLESVGFTCRLSNFCTGEVCDVSLSANDSKAECHLPTAIEAWLLCKHEKPALHIHLRQNLLYDCRRQMWLCKRHRQTAWASTRSTL